MTWIYGEMWSILSWNDEIFYTNFILRLLNLIFVSVFFADFSEIVLWVCYTSANQFNGIELKQQEDMMWIESEGTKQSKRVGFSKRNQNHNTKTSNNI